jgi:hypothetical protein
MDTVCRLCARQSNFLESVFSFQNNRLVADQIVVICPVKIEIEDDLPKQICEECLEIIGSASKLRETSVKSDVSFRTGKFSYPKERSEVPIKQEMIGVSEVNEDPFSNLDSYTEEDWLEEEDVPTSPNFNAHENEGPSNEQRSSATRSKPHQNLQVKRNHQAMTKKPFEIQIKTSKTEEASKDIVECDLCGFTSKKSNLQEHMRACQPSSLKDVHSLRQSSSGDHNCELCDMEFSTADILDRHKTRFHSEDDPYPCALCTFRYKTLHELKTHHGDVHSNEDFSSSQIHLEDLTLPTTTKQTNGGNHLRSQSARQQSSKSNLLRCQICRKLFPTREALKIHMQNHRKVTKSQERLHTCTKCGKKFMELKSFKHHMESHRRSSTRQLPTKPVAKQETPPSQFTCELCPSKFESHETLKSHMKDHYRTMERNFACDFCHKKFYTTMSLERHAKIHSEIEGFF